MNPPDDSWQAILGKFDALNQRLNLATLQNSDELERILADRQILVDRIRNLSDLAVAEPASVDQAAVAELAELFEQSLDPLRKLLVEREVLRHQLARSNQNRLVTEAREQNLKVTPRISVSG